MVTRVAGLMAERALLPTAAAVLGVAGIVGFVGGGVLGSLVGTDGFGDTEVAAARPDEAAAEAARVELTVVDASCERPAAVDAAQNPVEYRPEFAVNGDPDSAWQCRGDGVGQRLELDLGGAVAVVSVGLIPGYAKVDPHDGTEWYPLNRRLTEVRWHFDDGTSLSQDLDPDPDRRDLQTLDLPGPVTTSTLVLEIVSSTAGSSQAHPNIAVSEVEVRAAPAST